MHGDVSVPSLASGLNMTARDAEVSSAYPIAVLTFYTFQTTTEDEYPSLLTFKNYIRSFFPPVIGCLKSLFCHNEVKRSVTTGLSRTRSEFESQPLKNLGFSSYTEMFRFVITTLILHSVQDDFLYFSDNQ
jgi:hypothetical protein